MGTSTLLAACGDSEGTDDGTDGAGNAGGTGTGAGGTGNTGTGNSAGSGATGGMPDGPIGACAAMLVVRGSNFASDPHEVTIPLADIQAGVTKTYKSTGTTHTHGVTLTEADFAALAAGETVKKYSCFTPPSNTDHEWVFSCADPNVMPTMEGDFATATNCPTG